MSIHIYKIVIKRHVGPKFAWDLLKVYFLPTFLRVVWESGSSKVIYKCVCVSMYTQMHCAHQNVPGSPKCSYLNRRNACVLERKQSLGTECAESSWKIQRCTRGHGCMVGNGSIYFFTKNKKEEIDIRYRKKSKKDRKRKNQTVEMAPQRVKEWGLLLSLHGLGAYTIEDFDIIKRE